EHAEIDLLPAITQTNEPEQHFHFTAPYISFPVAIFALVDAPFYGNLNALTKKRVAVIKHHTIAEKIQHDYPKITLLSFADMQTALQALNARKVDAFVGNLVTTSHR
ncbi:transporter substrate-binding domain-containing protein, partial [Chromatium okenii]|uniref:transporter substrate-binding domain-containing protein n=1 Tax=Chromatium okenii TaxID=61644 RepID=UPI0026E95A9F